MLQKEKSEIKIALVELPATMNGDPFGKKIDDVYSLNRSPPRALPQLAAIADQQGFKNVRMISPETNGYQHLTDEEFKYLLDADVIGMSAISRTFVQTMNLAKLIRERNPDKFMIIGGQHATEDPATALQLFDAVVRYEGFNSFPEVLERFHEHHERPNLEGILGISYKDGEQQINAAKRPFLTTAQLSALPFPLYNKEIIKNATIWSIVTGYGCTYDCVFCSVITMNGREFRYRDADSAHGLIMHHHRLDPRKTNFWANDINNANPEQDILVGGRLRSQGIRRAPGYDQVRVEISRNRELLRSMRDDYNIVVHTFGLESVNDLTLALYHKQSSLTKTIESLRIVREEGALIHGMFVLGSDADTPETIKETVKFANKYCDSAQFFSLTPVIGTPQGNHLEVAGQVVTDAFWQYDALNAVIAPRLMTSWELMEGNKEAFRKFYSPWNPGTWGRIWRSPKRTLSLGLSVMGRKLYNKIEKQTRPYREQLKEIHPWQEGFNRLFHEWEAQVRDIALQDRPVAERKQDISALTRSYQQSAEAMAAQAPNIQEFARYAHEAPERTFLTMEKQYTSLLDFFAESREGLLKRLSIVAEKKDCTIQSKIAELLERGEAAHQQLQEVVGVMVGDVVKEVRVYYNNVLKKAKIPSQALSSFAKLKELEERMFANLQESAQTIITAYLPAHLQPLVLAPQYAINNNH